VSAGDLVEAGRNHVATGRIGEAMACFTRAADDPEQGAEALSLLAAAYLLPGALAPELALASAHRAARHPAVGPEHLTRCAAVALSAGDPVFAEELAGRVVAVTVHGEAAVPILATARLRLGDRAGVGRLLARVERAAGPEVFWRRLVVEASANGWVREALAARRAMRQAGLRAPGRDYVVIRAIPPVLYVGALLVALVLALAGPSRTLAELSLGGLLTLTGLAVRADAADQRFGSAAAGLAWMLAAACASLRLWAA